MAPTFTDEGRRVIRDAVEAAHQRGEGYVSTEHLLMGLIADPRNRALAILAPFNVTTEEIDYHLNRELPKPNGEPAPNSSLQEALLTPRAMRVIHHAEEEATELGAADVGSEHLLLGLIRERDGVAGQIFAKLNVTKEMVRTAIALREQGEEWIANTERPTPNTKSPTNPMARLPEAYAVSGLVALGLARKEREKYGHSSVTTEHLLLGVVADGESRVGAILLALGITPGEIRAALEREFQKLAENPRKLSEE